jgi:AraC-like DNA-binding protein
MSLRQDLRTINKKRVPIFDTNHDEKGNAMTNAWLETVVQTLQVAVGATLRGNVVEVNDTLGRIIRAIPAPQTPGDQIMFRNLLLEFGWRAAYQIHALAHGRRPASFAFRRESSVFDAFAERRDDARGALLHWLESFTRELVRSHVKEEASRAAEIIRAEYEKPVTAAALAPRVGVSVVQLERFFRVQFGLSLRDYREHARIVTALQDLDRIDTNKIEAVALQVGYQSKKNFYRAFETVMGMTPAAFRQLLPEERRQQIDTVRHRLVGLTLGPGQPMAH